MKRYIARFMILSLILVIIFGTIYAVGQQMLRQSANDPQIQFAEDFSSYISSGSNKPTELNTVNKVDIDKSLQIFAIAYDKAGNVTGSHALLDGKVPEIPKGVLQHAKPQNRVTWEPKKDVRIAAVVQAHDGGYVLAGRNLREVEKRTNTVLQLVSAGWLAAELGLTIFLASKTRTAKHSPHAKIKKY